MEMPNASQVTAALATLGMVAQYFGWTLPTQSLSDSNRAANFSARDQLQVCLAEKDELWERLVE